MLYAKPNQSEKDKYYNISLGVPGCLKGAYKSSSLGREFQPLVGCKDYLKHKQTKKTTWSLCYMWTLKKKK